MWCVAKPRKKEPAHAHTGVAKCFPIVRFSFYFFLPRERVEREIKKRFKINVCVFKRKRFASVRANVLATIASKPVMMEKSGMEFKVCKTICVFCILRAHPSYMVVQRGGVMCEHARTIQIRKWFFFLLCSASEHVPSVFLCKWKFQANIVCVCVNRNECQKWNEILRKTDVYQMDAIRCFAPIYET